ncbi:serine/threonine-protein kinase [Limnoglobus roseus]|uniref:Protein kinase domain-containing protein n=1 Tax=Limnoglobus roseus TaxID=2598579 RepID=A0A5C1A625_9BACT|nr:serine/threonine-protein kinase [Limnoglobus roseus]QEL14120.1 hypothetical protein PX52LOC_00986 [Limnoglobus roseus]
MSNPRPDPPGDSRDHEAAEPSPLTQTVIQSDQPCLPSHPVLVRAASVDVPADPLPRVPGHEVLAELGRGGMGVVYRAVDLGRSEAVAVKTLRPGASLSRFKSEFRTLTGVRHPNLVALHRLIAAERDWFLTMELVDGPDFLAHLRDGANDGRLRDAFRQLAAGVHALHAAGVLHRDLKPANVKVTPTGRVVILDFGLAADVHPAGDPDATSHSVLGTPAYMAPEQAVGRPVTPACDWYAVGGMLYAALTGERPFAGAAADVIRAKQERDGPRPSAVRPDVPPDLDALCGELLRRDPTARPTGVEVLARLGEAAAALPAAQGVFVGRADALARLDAAFAELRAGKVVVVSVHGPSGVGKSALVGRFLQGVAAAGGLVLSGRCYEAEAVPFKALDGVVDALARHLRRLLTEAARRLLPRDVGPLVRVFPVLREIEAAADPTHLSGVDDPQDRRRRAFGGLREALTRVAETRPVVVAVDDLQWGDADSAALIAALVAPPAAPPVLWLVGYRTDGLETSACLKALGEAGPFRDRRDIPLAPLTDPEARELAERLHAGAADADLDIVVREARGNPFFVGELVRDLATAGAWPAGRANLDDRLWERAGRLTEGERTLLEVVAAAGRPVPAAVAIAAAALDEGATTAVGNLREGRWLRDAGDGELAAYHDRVRETVASRLEPALAARHHRRLAEAFERGGNPDPERLAGHWLAAGEPGRAAGLYLAAARRAAGAFAFERAAGLYRTALSLPARCESEPELRTALADALTNAGRGTEAAREILRVADLAPPADRDAVRLRAAMLLLTSGRYAEGVSILREVLPAAGLTYPASRRAAFARLIWTQLRLRLRGLGYRRRSPGEAPPALVRRVDVCQEVVPALGAADPLRGFGFATAGLLDALRLGDPQRIASFLSIEAANQGFAGNPTRADRLLEVGRRALAEAPAPQYAAGLTLCRGIVDYTRGRWREADEHARAAQRQLRALGRPAWWEVGTAQMFEVYAKLFRGHFGELLTLIPAYLAEARQRSDVYAEGNLVTFALPAVAAVCHAAPTVEADLDELLDRWGRDGVQFQHLNVLHTKTQLAYHRGDWDQAAARLAETERQMRAVGAWRFQVGRISVAETRLRLLLARGSEEGRPPAAPEFARAIRALRREKVVWANALADGHQAAFENLNGMVDRAVVGLRVAVAALTDVGMELHAAAARRQLGTLVGGDDGRSLVTAADDWMKSQGVLDPAFAARLYSPGFRS